MTFGEFFLAVVMIFAEYRVERFGFGLNLFWLGLDIFCLYVMLSKGWWIVGVIGAPDLFFNTFVTRMAWEREHDDDDDDIDGPFGWIG